MFTLKPLLFDFDELEPYLDAQTVEIHYVKHHQTYLNKLNEALAKYPELESWSLDDLLIRLGEVPEDIRIAVKNHGGGAWNHDLYFATLRPGREDNSPAGKIAKKIDEQWGSFDLFKEQFANLATTLFGSGWTWLVVDTRDQLQVLNLPNQDCPLSQGLRPILVCDIWEHAYYLKSQNRRGEYVDNWWKLVNWDKVNELFG